MFFPKCFIALGFTFGSWIHFELIFIYGVRWASLVAQMAENPPAVQDIGFDPRGRSPGGGHGNPLQYSCLENLCGQRRGA